MMLLSCTHREFDVRLFVVVRNDTPPLDPVSIGRGLLGSP